jgi:nitroreductase
MDMFGRSARRARSRPEDEEIEEDESDEGPMFVNMELHVRQHGIAVCPTGCVHEDVYVDLSCEVFVRLH